MDEQRLEAYQQLIQALLDCPSGEEGEILAANPDLLDEGFVRTVARGAAGVGASAGWKAGAKGLAAEVRLCDRI